jgi:hypothetical protein
MKVAYDSEADALSIDLVEVDRWDFGEEVEGTSCTVAIRDGRPVNVELLSPGEHLDQLKVAAKRFDLNGEALLAAAHAGLASPDHPVKIEIDGFSRA